MLFSALSPALLGFPRSFSDLAILTAASTGATTQLTNLTPTVINPFRISPLVLSILLSNAIAVNPLQGLYPLTWDILILPSVVSGSLM